MAQVATVSRMERNKPLFIGLLCAIFAVWFAYDGWHNWPLQDNAMVQRVVKSPKVIRRDKLILQKWPGYNQATGAQISQAGQLVHENNFSGWHSATDVAFQKVIVVFLAAVAVGAIAWYVKGRKRRISADEQGLSPAVGSVIPWDRITTIDNTRWPKSRIVIITYHDSANTPQKIKLDDYVYDNLRPVLNEIATRATLAAMLPPVNAASPETASEPAGR